MGSGNSQPIQQDSKEETFVFVPLKTTQTNPVSHEKRPEASRCCEVNFVAATMDKEKQRSAVNSVDCTSLSSGNSVCHSSIQAQIPADKSKSIIPKQNYNQENENENHTRSSEPIDENQHNDGEVKFVSNWADVLEWPFDDDVASSYADISEQSTLPSDYKYYSTITPTPAPRRSGSTRFPRSYSVGRVLNSDNQISHQNLQVNAKDESNETSSNPPELLVSDTDTTLSHMSRLSYLLHQDQVVVLMVNAANSNTNSAKLRSTSSDLCRESSVSEEDLANLPKMEYERQNLNHSVSPLSSFGQQPYCKNVHENSKFFQGNSSKDRNLLPNYSQEIYIKPNSHNIQKDMATDVPLAYSLAQTLIQCKNFKAGLGWLSENLDMRLDEIITEIDLNKGTFSKRSKMTEEETVVRLRPKIKLCSDYNAYAGCRNELCFAVHICQYYVFDTCKDKLCKYTHTLRGVVNNSIFKSFCLDCISENSLKNILRKVWKGSVYPKICFPYHRDTCPKTNCMDLHLCYRHVMSLGLCPGVNTYCPLNHDIHDSNCEKVFNFYEVSTNETPRDLMRYISYYLKKTETPR